MVIHKKASGERGAKVNKFGIFSFLMVVASFMALFL